jgi:hypothetical protein
MTTWAILSRFTELVGAHPGQMRRSHMPEESVLAVDD